MKALLLPLLVCAVSAGQGLVKPAAFTEGVSHTTSEPRAKPRRHRSPLHYVKRLAEMEVNLAFQFSSIGIRDTTPPPDRGEAAQVRQVSAPATDACYFPSIGKSCFSPSSAGW
jgi:hypothetical protein